MTTEIRFPEEDGTEQVVDVETVHADPADLLGRQKPNGKKKDDAEKDEPGTALSPVLKQVRNLEDLSIKEMLDAFGNDGAFTVRIVRKWPEYGTDANGKRVQVSGFLAKVERPIDEEWLQQQYGGGTFELTIRRRNARTGKYEQAANRTLTIAGEPNLAELPRSVHQVSVGPTPAAPEAPSVVTKTLDFMERQLEKAEERADRADRPPPGRSTDDPMVDILREQLRETRLQSQALSSRLEQLQQAILHPEPSIEDRTKEKLLDKLIDQDSARLQAVRAQFESEIRQLKESAIEDVKRIQDRFDRERDQMMRSHERELNSAKGSFDIQLQAAKTSFETSLAAKTAAFDTQKEILQAEIRRLERDNAELRDDLKELRAKKDKTLVEQVKEIEIIKDALGLDEGDKSTAEKIVEAITNPEAIAAVGQMLGKQPPEQQAQAAQQQAEARIQRPRVVRDKETGQKYIVAPDGKTMRPAKPPPVPGQPQLPPIPPEVIEQVVGYLERAYSAGTDPEIVAQSARAQVPEPILMAIRDVGGVDAFLTKVAKLPSSSPLSSTQAGKNWVRKVGKALIGE